MADKKEAKKPDKKPKDAKPKASGGGAGGSGGKITWILWFVFFVVIFVPLYFMQMNSFSLPFTDGSEAREAEVVGEMYNFGNYLTPVPNEDRIPTKPFTLHWVALAISALLGSVSEFSIRMSSLLYACGIVVMTFFIARHMFSGRAAFISALTLATSSGFWIYSTTVRVDIALAFFCTASFGFFYVGYLTDKGINYVLFWLCLAMTVLSKGPVGLAIVLIPVLVFCVIKLSWKSFWREDTLYGLVGFIAIVGGWMIIAYLNYGDNYFKQAWDESGARALSPDTVYSDAFQEPFYWYVPKFFSFFFPWSLLFPIALVFSFGKGIFSDKESPLYAVLWFTIAFVGFSFIAYKRKAYLLPLLPAAALIIGGFIDSTIEDAKGRKGLLLAISSVVFLMAGMGMLTLALAFLAPDFYAITVAKYAHGRFGELLKEFSSRNAQINLSIGLGISGLLCVLGFVFMTTRKFLAGFVSIVMSFFIAAAMMSFWISPKLDGNPDNPRAFVRNTVERHVGADDAVVFYKDGYDYAVIFYAKRRIPRLERDGINDLLMQGVQVYLIAAEENRLSVENDFPETFMVVGKNKGTKRNLILMGLR